MAAVPFRLTPALWKAIYRRVLRRAVDLTRSLEKARDLTQDAMADALDPETHQWDPGSHPDLTTYLCDRVWSRYGNEQTSFRVTNASQPLDEAPDVPDLYSGNPLSLLL